MPSARDVVAVDLTQALLDASASSPRELPSATVRNGSSSALQSRREKARTGSEPQRPQQSADAETEMHPEEELTDDFFPVFSQLRRNTPCSRDARGRWIAREGGTAEDEHRSVDGTSPPSLFDPRTARPALTLASPDRSMSSASPRVEDVDGDEEERDDYDDSNNSSSSGSDARRGRRTKSKRCRRSGSAQTSRGRETASSPASPASPIAASLTEAMEERRRAAAIRQWPLPCPPPATAQPRPGQSRLNFHTQRYGAFVRAYCGLRSDEEVRQAQRRARSICVIGISKQAKGRGAAAGTQTRAARTFLRHSVLAVEGDAVFNELVERSEMLYAAELQRAQHTCDAVKELCSAKSKHGEGVKSEGEATTAGAGEAAKMNGGEARPSRGERKDAAPSSGVHELMKKVLMPCVVARHGPAKVPRVADPHLRPNARCIALHYGLSASAVAAQQERGEEDEGGAGAPPYHARVSLMAVVSTTRVEEGEEIYVSLESYHRCLDEVAWHRQRYGEHSHSIHAGQRHATAGAPDGDDGAAQNALVHGDVYTGVKQFRRWPKGVRFYHGVGAAHSSGDVAEASFPFTLLDLTLAPELGETELGVVASGFVPYATCFLYTGPAIATTRVEKIVSSTAHTAATTSSSSSGGDSSAGEREEEECGAKRGRASGRKRHTPRSTRAAAKVPPAADDIDFALDDTYALGLGRHGVCFGQGVARYINHRYNMSRFGNVELCSVMLSVPSEFSRLQEAPPTATRRRRRQRGRVGGGGGHTHAARKASSTAARSSCGSGAAAPAVARDTREATAHSSATSHAVADGARGVEDYVDALQDALYNSRKRRRRATQPRSRIVFFEEDSHFITVPFFIATTDIEVGTPLLAWTYGEEYDARLERVAVADGALVPYADGELLNARPMMGEADAPLTADTAPQPPAIRLSPACPHSPHGLPPQSPVTVRRWQRYGGDYRFALGVGDIVWRRRPVLASAMAAALSGVTAAQARAFVPCRCGRCAHLCPPAERDLFVVVQLMQHSMERVLLLPLEKTPLSEGGLRALLKSQHLTSYISPFAPAAELERCLKTRPATPLPEAADADSEDEVSIILGAKLYSRTASGANSLAGSATTTPVPHRRRPDRAEAGGADSSVQQRQQQRIAAKTHEPPASPRRALSEEWAVFETHASAAAAFTDPHRLLRRCVVATTDSLGLLLPDVDYVAVKPSGRAAASDTRASPSTSSRAAAAAGKRGQPSSIGANGVDGDPTATANPCILVNLDDLRHSTLLVRSSPRVCGVPEMPNGLLWPILRKQTGALGGPWLYATDKRKALQ